MEVGRVSSAMALRLPMLSRGPRLSSRRVTSPCHVPWLQCASPSSASSSVSRLAVRVSSDGPQRGAYDEGIETLLDPSSEFESPAANLLTSEHKALLALLISLGFALGSAEVAMALGPEGPLVEEFWDNMRRYALYFLTVFTGGLYSLMQPIFSLLRNPFTAVLTVAFLSGSFYLLYLLLNTMLGITSFNYEYS